MAGGETRSQSVWNGVKKVAADISHVVIHDAARPCIADVWIDKVFAAAQEHGAAILVTPIDSTIKKSADDNFVAETVDRDKLYLAQTPQIFQRQILNDAFGQVIGSDQHISFTDESQMLESLGVKVRMVPGSLMNIKITTKLDMALATAILKVLPTPKFDAPPHPFKDDNIWR